MRIYIDTLGCPKNVSDSEYAAGLLTEAGHIIVADPGDADVILVNTCGFINDAKEESIDRILELSKEKPEDGILIVSGCLSQRYGEDLGNALPEADIVIGVNEYHTLPQILSEYERGKQKVFFSSYEKEYSEMRKSISRRFVYFLPENRRRLRQCVRLLRNSLHSRQLSQQEEGEHFGGSPQAG